MSGNGSDPVEEAGMESVATDAPILSVRGLRKRFGATEAVRGVNFDIARGAVVGFIGANGAGKTTTMRMLATLEWPDDGTIRFNGMDALSFPSQVRRRLGWMPDQFGVYKNTTVFDYLDFHARAARLKGRRRLERLKEVMAFTELDQIATREISQLSKGMGQRLCLGRTLLHDPELLILDEPAAGLDPKARIEFRNLVAFLARQGKTLLISSHILSELGEMCDHILFIDKGRIVHEGSAESLRNLEDGRTMVEVRLDGPLQPLLEWVALQDDVSLQREQRDSVLLEVSNGDNPLAPILRRMIEAGLAVSGFQKMERRLEEAFIDLVKKLEGSQEPPPLP